MPPETETARFYENHIRRFGYGYRALGFGRRSSQEKRFQTALGLGGSRAYLDRAAFAHAGVELKFQEFTHPVYPQRGPAPFIAGLSAVDLLFNHTTFDELSIAA